jgi:hypothetical protein
MARNKKTATGLRMLFWRSQIMRRRASSGPARPAAPPAHAVPERVRPAAGAGRLCFALLGSLLSLPAYAQVSQAVTDQWFTGPLVAPSPALPQAGLWDIEPYAITTLSTGSYDAGGHQHGASNEPRTETLLSLFEYGLTNRLSIQAVPAFDYSWNGVTTTRGVAAGDLPVDLKYRALDQDPATGAPSVTLGLGVSFPTGPYDKLGSALDGTGTGAFYLRQQIILQSIFDTPGNHPLRVRLWGEFEEPLNNPTLRDMSVYGTDKGFHGVARPGFQATAGLSPEYGLTQRGVLAADIVYGYADCARVTGSYAGTGYVDTTHGSSGNWSFAPAVEYNWSPRYGIIAGVQFTFAGHNSGSYVAPQIAFNMVF